MKRTENEKKFTNHIFPFSMDISVSKNEKNLQITIAILDDKKVAFYTWSNFHSRYTIFFFYIIVLHENSKALRQCLDRLTGRWRPVRKIEKPGNDRLELMKFSNQKSKF